LSGFALFKWKEMRKTQFLSISFLKKMKKVFLGGMPGVFKFFVIAAFFGVLMVTIAVFVTLYWSVFDRLSHYQEGPTIIPQTTTWRPQAIRHSRIARLRALVVRNWG